MVVRVLTGWSCLGLWVRAATKPRHPRYAQVTKSWSTKKAGQSLGERVRSLATNPLAIQWVVYIALFWCVFLEGRCIR